MRHVPEPVTPRSGSNRARIEAALAGEPVEKPVYAVYDWFVENRPIDWNRLFDLGLGQFRHAYVMEHRRPHVQVVETTREDPSGQVRKDVRWITDIGELHEYYLGEWRQEYLVKTPADYRILARAFSDVEVLPKPEVFTLSEEKVGDNGISLGCTPVRRTAFQAIQIDYAGLEQFSVDLATGAPELFEAIEVMNALTYKEIEVMARTPVRHVKLWENLSIETMGPKVFRQFLLPVYERMLGILRGADKKLCVHYDGKLRVISQEISRLGFHGLDSVTPPPEGDMGIADCRRLWPDKFLWLHPPLGWYNLPEKQLVANVRQMMKDAGEKRYCLMISEDVPPAWERTVPSLLEALR